LALDLGKKQSECILQGQFVFDKKLDVMLASNEPLIAELMDGSSFIGSLKFHQK
jgi:hypothetical protein